MEGYKSVYKRLCRVCLKPSKHKMVCLLDRTADDGLSCFGKSLKIFSICDIQLDDDLPTKMCRKCLHLLRNSIKLKLTCEQSDKYIKRLLKSHAVNDPSFKKTFVQYCFYINNFITPKYDNIKKNTTINNKDKTTANKERDSKIKYEISIELLRNDDDLRNSEARGDSLDTNSKNNDNKSTNNDDFNVNDDFHDSDERKDSVNDYEDNKYISDEKKFYDDYDNKSEILHDMFDIMEKAVGSGEVMDIDTKETVYVDEIEDNSVDVPKTQCKRSKRPRRGYPLKKTTCDICQKVYSTPATMRLHRNRHGSFNFMCEICAKAYPSKKELILHQSTRHDIGNTFFCEYCDFKTSRKIDLIEHIRFHTGERPFACEKCGLTFRRKFIYTKHLVHHSEKKVQCLHCPARFFHKSHMLAHCNSVHERRYVFSCIRCTAMYAKSASLRKHYISKHDIPREQQVLKKIYQNPKPPVRNLNRRLVNEA